MKNLLEQYLKKVQNKKPINEINIQFTKSKGMRELNDFANDDDVSVNRMMGQRKTMAKEFSNAIAEGWVDPFEVCLGILNILKSDWPAVRDYLDVKLDPSMVQNDEEGFSAQDDLSDEEDFMSKIS